MGNPKSFLKTSETLDFKVHDDEAPPVVHYVPTDKGFRLFTLSAKALLGLKKQKIYLEYRNKHFEGFCEKLPKVPGIEIKKFETKPCNQIARKRLTKLFAQYEALSANIDKMIEKQDELRRELRGEVIQHGLRTKPGCSRDSMVLLEDLQTRLHTQEAIYKSYDDEALREHAKKYRSILKAYHKEEVLTIKDPKLLDELLKTSRLKKAVKKETRYTRLNRRTLEKEILPKLPAEVVTDILEFHVELHFQCPEELPNPECSHCGGKVLKGTDCCKICGLPALSKTKS